VIDENNVITGESGILLVQGIDATADEIVDRARAFGGISILAHIDRPVYSYVAVLGMIPKDLEVDAVELSANLSEKEALQWLNETGGRPVIRSSDAHRIPDISIERTTPVLLKKPSFDELGLALKGIHGRRVLWPWGQDQT
ncbi:MAG TPA: PHP domain-containing protein, partial [Synergistales bacterium]|nr:PHP domain-containing protein [Synergistales bacterium]